MMISVVSAGALLECLGGKLHAERRDLVSTISGLRRSVVTDRRLVP
jgi:hypothetical protein